MEYHVGDTVKETEERVVAFYNKHKDFFLPFDIEDGHRLFEVLSWNIPTVKPRDEMRKVTINPQFHVDLINKCVRGYTVDVLADTDVSKMLGEDSPVVETVFVVVATDTKLNELKHSVHEALKFIIDALTQIGLWPHDTGVSRRLFNDDDDNGGDDYRGSSGILASKHSEFSYAGNYNNNNNNNNNNDDDDNRTILYGNDADNKYTYSNSSDWTVEFNGDFQICDPSLRGLELVQHCTHSTIFGLFLRVCYFNKVANNTAKCQSEGRDCKSVLINLCNSFFESVIVKPKEGPKPVPSLVGYWKTNTVINFGTRFTVFNGCGYSRSTTSPWCLWDPATGLLSCFCQYDMFEKNTILGNAKIQADCIRQFVSNEAAPQSNIHPVITACHSLYIPDTLNSNDVAKQIENRDRYWIYTDDSVGIVENIGLFWWTRSYESIDEMLVEILFKPILGITTCATPLMSQVTLEEVVKLGRITNSKTARIDAKNTEIWAKALKQTKTAKTINMPLIDGKYVLNIADIKV
jgi:hypothetical protein